MDGEKISFAKYDDTGSLLVAWSPSEELAWNDAVVEGADRADELVRYLRETDDRPMFDRVVREAVAGGKSGALTGFLDRIAERLCHSVPFLCAVVFL